MTRHILPDLSSYATHSYFPHPSAQKPENVAKIVLRFKGCKEELTLVKTWIDRGERLEQRRRRIRGRESKDRGIKKGGGEL